MSDIVIQSVVETLNSMFGQSVLPAPPQPAVIPDNVVISCVKLNHGVTDVDFCFRFDMQLLLQAASIIFTPEYIKSNPVLEDLACEIANIVCQKVKAYLNDVGYFTDMGFPFVPKDNQVMLLEQADLVHMHFFYQDKSARQSIGVAVNFTVV